MKNTPSFSNTSAKMISKEEQPLVVIFLALSFKKDDIQRETVNHFVELLTDINEMEIIHTNLSASSDFPPM